MSEAVAIRVLEQCADWVVCIKPVGLDSEHALPDLLRQQLGGDLFPVHRLDRAVGGIMLFARTSRAAAVISADIQAGRLVKEYVLQCHGALPSSEGRMEDLLWKDSRKNKVFVVSRLRKGVRPALLRYRVLSSPEEDRILVLVRLETGRSHQIRVQFASRRCPLWGDHLYGAKDREKNPLLFSCGITFPWQGQLRSFRFLPDWAPDIPDEG